MLPWHRLACISENFFRGANCHHKRPLHHHQHHHWLGLRALCWSPSFVAAMHGSYLVYFYLTTLTFLRRSMNFFLLSSAGFFRYCTEGRVETSWHWTEFQHGGVSSTSGLSMRRLPTPTICRRSVPAYCNAGLPKRRNLSQGKINKMRNVFL